MTDRVERWWTMVESQCSDRAKPAQPELNGRYKIRLMLTLVSWVPCCILKWIMYSILGEWQVQQLNYKVLQVSPIQCPTRDAGQRISKEGDQAGAKECMTLDALTSYEGDSFYQGRKGSRKDKGWRNLGTQEGQLEMEAKYTDLCIWTKKGGRGTAKEEMKMEMSTTSLFKIPWIMNFRGRRTLLLSMYRYFLA